MPPSHMLYLDDSGNKEYAKPGQEYDAHGGPSHYFVYGGALSTFDEAARLAESLQHLKRRWFGTNRVEVKSHWLRRPDRRKRHYLDPFGVTDADLDRFVEDYYETVISSDIQLLAAVVDKVHMVQRYGSRAYSPSAFAYEIVVQRVANALRGTSSKCGVVVDDMTGANPTGSEYKQLLSKQHTSLRAHGSRLRKGLSLECLANLSFKNSALSDLVQVADIVSYNVLRQFRLHGDEWETKGLGTLPTYDYFARVAAKFRRGPGGRIQGYGVVKAPLLRRVPWSVRSKQ